MIYIPTSLCHIEGLSCFGCCGHDFTNKKEIEQGIRKNTIDYHKYKDKKEFRDRSKYIRDCGICYNLIFFKKNVVGCPLHPLRNNGIDFRENYCEIDHLCKAAYMYNQFSKEEKKKFIQFLKSKNLDWYEYSVRMDNDELINSYLDPE